jgi:uncharacterized damage-inducible protein DinB
MSTEAAFLEFSGRKLVQLLARIETCAGQLDETQIWWRAGENANSVGNLCLHLAGNVRQWIVHGVGGAADVRERDGEFEARGGLRRGELLARLRGTVEEALTVIAAQQDLLRMVKPQTYEVTVLEAIYHVVEHFAQHTAQIIYATKAFTGEDLGFYGHLKKPQAAKDPTP